MQRRWITTSLVLTTVTLSWSTSYSSDGRDADPELTTATAPAAAVERVTAGAPSWCAGFDASDWAGDCADSLNLGFYAIEQRLLGRIGEGCGRYGISHWPEVLPMRPAGDPYTQPAPTDQADWLRKGTFETYLTYLNGFTNPIASLRELQAIAIAGCERPADGARQRRVANWIQQWINIHRLSVADATELMRELVHPLPNVSGGTLNALFERATPAARELLWTGKAPRAGVHASRLDYLDRHPSGDPDALYHAFGLAMPAAKETPAWEAKAQKEIAAAEFATFDWTRFDGQFDSKSARQRFVLRALLPRFKAYAASLFEGVATEPYLASKKDFENLTTQEADLARMALDLADRRWNADGSLKPDAEWRTIMAGCAAPLEALWEKLAFRQTPTSVEALAAIDADPALDALYGTIAAYCRDSWLWSSVASDGRFDTILSGPRAWHLTRQRKANTAPSKRAPVLGWLLFGSKETIERCPPNDQTPQCAVAYGAKIATAKLQADGVLVTWVAPTWREDAEVCHTTNRVDRINSKGEVFYQEECRVVGTKKVTGALAPTLLPADLAPLLKPGRVARLFKERPSGTPNPAWVVAALFPDMANARKSTKHLVIFGKATKP